jgi:hypothetical protein
MHTLKIDTDPITLPDAVAKKLIGKLIEFIGLKDGFMMKTLIDDQIYDPIKEARGMLKGKGFSTERYFRLKEEDTAIERRSCACAC